MNLNAKESQVIKSMQAGLRLSSINFSRLFGLFEKDDYNRAVATVHRRVVESLKTKGAIKMGWHGSVSGYVLPDDQQVELSSTAKGCRASIQAACRAIGGQKASVNELAKMYVDEFHFMDQEASLFWTCDTSPIGMCVFNLDDKGRKQNCRYCGQPSERK